MEDGVLGRDQQQARPRTCSAQLTLHQVWARKAGGDDKDTPGKGQIFQRLDHGQRIMLGGKEGQHHGRGPDLCQQGRRKLGITTVHDTGQGNGTFWRYQASAFYRQKTLFSGLRQVDKSGIRTGVVGDHQNRITRMTVQRVNLMTGKFHCGAGLYAFG